MSRRLNQRVKANGQPTTLGEAIPERVWRKASDAAALNMKWQRQKRVQPQSQATPKEGRKHAPQSGESPPVAPGPTPAAHPVKPTSAPEQTNKRNKP